MAGAARRNGLHLVHFGKTRISINGRSDAAVTRKIKKSAGDASPSSPAPKLDLKLEFPVSIQNLVALRRSCVLKGIVRRGRFSLQRKLGRNLGPDNPFFGPGISVLYGQENSRSRFPGNSGNERDPSHPQLWIRESVLSPYQKRHIVHSTVSEGK